MGDLKNTLENKEKKNALDWDKVDAALNDALAKGDDMETALSKLGKKSRSHARHPLRKFTPTGVESYKVYNKGGKKRKSRKTRKTKKNKKSRKSRK